MSNPPIPDALQRKLDTLPEGPGVYLWKDAAGEVLYVGKAKRLRSRVRSYFATDFAVSAKNLLLQRLIADVETIVVPSEAQSLILENNLIKEYRPRFNVRLKDDKSYPSIAVTLGEHIPPRPRHPEPQYSGGPLFRPLHRRGTAAPHARAHPPHLHDAQLSRRSPAGAPRAPLPRLPHRQVPGALRRVAGRGVLSPDGQRCRPLSRGQDSGPASEGA